MGRHCTRHAGPSEFKNMPDDVKAKAQEALDGIRSGKIKIPQVL